MTPDASHPAALPVKAEGAGVGPGRLDAGPVPSGRKAAIARSFDAAAASYDAHAAVQREVARRLADRIAGLDLPPAPRVLEVGCGTGLLSEALLRRLPGAQCLFTDLAPAMVRRCREKLSARGGVGFAVMDGEAPAVAGGFDLVTSSFAFQWFLDLGGSVDRLALCLKVGGRLVFSTLGAETFAEWRAAHAALGLPYGGAALSTAAALRRRIGAVGEGGEPPALRGAIEEERILRRYPEPRAFLRELKGLGADVPGPGHRPLTAGSLRRLLRRIERAAGNGDGFAVTYHVLYGSFVRTKAASHAAPRLSAVAAPSR